MYFLPQLQTRVSEIKPATAWDYLDFTDPGYGWWTMYFLAQLQTRVSEIKPILSIGDWLDFTDPGLPLRQSVDGILFQIITWSPEYQSRNRNVISNKIPKTAKKFWTFRKTFVPANYDRYFTSRRKSTQLALRCLHLLFNILWTQN